MNFPSKLNPGDMVGIAAPSMPIPKESISTCIMALKNLGYSVTLGEAVFQNKHGYLAGDGILRAKDLNHMFQNPLIKAIFCVRGGYGSSHVIPYLDYEMIRHNPKIFIGYSDITNLHTVLIQKCHLVTFHGPMVYSNLIEHFDPYTQQSLTSALNMGKCLNFSNPPDTPFKIINRPFFWKDPMRKFSGRIVGGNLTLLTRALGTCYELDTKNQILFLEEVQESVAHIDLMITQLMHSGKFNHIRGLVLGTFTGCGNKPYDENYTIEQYFYDTFSQFPVPVIYHIQCGHGFPMGTIPLGVNCEISCSPIKLTFYRKKNFSLKEKG